MELSTEKNAQCESCELSFIWGKNEGYSPGDGISDSSENLLQRRGGGRGGGQQIRDFGEGVRAVEHTSWQKVAAGHEEQMSPLVMLVLF